MSHLLLLRASSRATTTAATCAATARRGTTTTAIAASSFSSSSSSTSNSRSISSISSSSSPSAPHLRSSSQQQKLPSLLQQRRSFYTKEAPQEGTAGLAAARALLKEVADENNTSSSSSSSSSLATSSTADRSSEALLSSSSDDIAPPSSASSTFASANKLIEVLENSTFAAFYSSSSSSLAPNSNSPSLAERTKLHTLYLTTFVAALKANELMLATALASYSRQYSLPLTLCLYRTLILEVAKSTVSANVVLAIISNAKRSGVAVESEKKIFEEAVMRFAGRGKYEDCRLMLCAMDDKYGLVPSLNVCIAITNTLKAHRDIINNYNESKSDERGESNFPDVNFENSIIDTGPISNRIDKEQQQLHNATFSSAAYNNDASSAATNILLEEYNEDDFEACLEQISFCVQADPEFIASTDPSGMGFSATLNAHPSVLFFPEVLDLLFDVYDARQSSDVFNEYTSDDSDGGDGYKNKSLDGDDDAVGK
jgi:hypothetical protein